MIHVRHLKNLTVSCILFMRKSPRYIAVAGIFLLAIYYNLAIALPPEKPNDVAKNQGDASMMATKTFADLDLSHPSKRYEHFLLSVPGDWYRVGLVAQSLDEDEDESLRVSLVSAFGKNQELGTVTVTKGDGERYFEFLILADASYEDVLVEKVQSASGKNVWAGGQVRLTNMFVSRLSVKDTRDIKALAPTVFGEKDARITLTDGEDVSSGINLPRDTHFLQGQTFKISGDAYLLSANIRIKQNNRFGSGKYRIELREYEPVSKKVGDQPLRRTTFSVKDLKSLIDAEGSYRLNVPYRLEAGKSYFLGISDDYVKSGKKIALETFHSVDDTANVTSSYFSLSTVNTVRGKDLLTHAVVEDLGPSFRYRYAAHHTVTDMMDVFASSDKVSFDSGTATVMGKESVGTFFTYKIDTMRPFGDFRMEATQVGNDDNQVRLEYSFDNDFWKEIPSMDGQVNDASKTFDLILHDAGKQTSVVYVRVSYAGLKDGSGSFGLSNFRVTATMPKDTSQKLSR